MRKIVSLFQRNYDGDRLVRDEVVPGAEWVQAGEGVATRKYDGICMKVESGKLFKRYDAKNGKTPPTGFVPAQDPDPTTGHWPGWLPIGEGPEDALAREALANAISDGQDLSDGTYELCGPRISTQRFKAHFNPDGFEKHVLVPHGKMVFEDFPRSFDGIKARLENETIEGVVWHHPDGRMVKIKRRDFFQMEPKLK